MKKITTVFKFMIFRFYLISSRTFVALQGHLIESFGCEVMNYYYLNNFRKNSSCNNNYYVVSENYNNVSKNSPRTWWTAKNDSDPKVTQLCPPHTVMQ